MEQRMKAFAMQAEGVADAEGELRLINERFALEPLAADEVYIRRMRLCNDAVDRTGERFPLGYLERFRETIPGKALLLAHDKQSLPLGRFLRAEVVATGRRGDGATGRQGQEAQHELVTWFYLRKTPQNAEIRAQIDAGVISYCSIGFRWADLTCDLCGESYVGGRCEHVIGRTYDGRECTATYGGDLGRVEAVEGSLVYLGAQYGAVVTKGVEGMEMEQAQAKIAELEGLHQEAVTRLAAVEALKAASEARACALETERAQLVEAGERERALAADGAIYRTDLKAEVARLAALVGAAKEAALLMEALADARAERWKELKAEYERRVEERFPLRGVGELPGTGRPGDGGTGRGGDGARVSVGAHSLI